MSASGCWSGTVTSGHRPNATRSQSWTDSVLTLGGHTIGRNRRPRRRRDPDHLHCPPKNSSHSLIFYKHPLILGVAPPICCVPPKKLSKGEGTKLGTIAIFSPLTMFYECQKSFHPLKNLLVGGAGFEPATPGL